MPLRGHACRKLGVPPLPTPPHLACACARVCGCARVRGAWCVVRGAWCVAWAADAIG